MCQACGDTLVREWTSAELDLAEQITTALMCKAAAVSPYTELALAEQRLRDRLTRSNIKIAKPADRWYIDEVKRAKKFTEAFIERTTERYITRWDRWADDNAAAVHDVVEMGHHAAKTVIYQRAFGAPRPAIYNGPPFESTAPKAELEVPVEKAAAYAGVKPSVTLPDVQAIDQIAKGQQFWIGNYHTDIVQTQVVSISRDVLLLQGLPREVAAERLALALGYNNGYLPVKPVAHVPTGWNGSTKQYFDGVAANAATVSRIHGSLTAMVELGFDVYEILNPIDERTCPICDSMNGEILEVRPAFQHVTDVIGASDPAAVQDLAPWLNPTQFAAELKASGAGGMIGKGLGYPPFHFKCFQGDTPVWTSEGLKPISRVRVGDRVLTHRGRYQRVNAVMKRPHQGEVVDVLGVTATPDHPFLISRFTSGKKSAVFSAVAKGDEVAKIRKEKRHDFLPGVRRTDQGRVEVVRVQGLYTGHAAAGGADEVHSEADGGGGRALRVRASAVRAEAWVDVSPRLLPTATRHLHRGQGLVSTGRTRPVRGAISRNVGVDPSGGNEAFGFVPVGAIERRPFNGVVWNLTVEEDETYVVGAAGLAVHNCRCSIDVRPDAISRPVTVPPATKVPPKAKPVTPKTPANYQGDKVAPIEFDALRLERAMKDPKRQVSGLRTEANMTAIRQQMNSLMYEESGMFPKDIVHAKGSRGAFVVGVQGGASGSYHIPSGGIGIVREAYDDAVRFVGKIKRGAKTTAKERSGFHTIVHETAHSASGISSKAFSGVGASIEEATTEAAARLIMRKFGSDVTEGAYGWHLNRLNLANGRSLWRTKKFMGDKAYGAGIPADSGSKEAYEFLGRVSQRMRRGTSKKLFKTVEEYTDHYINSVVDEAVETITRNNGGKVLRGLDKYKRELRKQLNVQMTEFEEVLLDTGKTLGFV
jgi:hypothetical protein